MPYVVYGTNPKSSTTKVYGHSLMNPVHISSLSYQQEENGTVLTALMIIVKL